MFCFDQNNQNEFLYFFCNIYKNIFIKVEINFCDVTKWPEICFKFDFWLLTLYYKVLSFSCLQQNIIDLILHPPPWRGGCYRKQSMVPLSYRRADAVSRAHAGNPTRPPPPDVCVGRFLAGCSNFASFFDNIVLSASLFKNLELHVEKSTEDHDVTVDFTSDHKVHKNVY